MLTYNTRLLGSQGDLESLKQLLVYEQLTFNEASKIQFLEPKKSIVILHSKFYYGLRKWQPQIPTQVLICAEKACLSAYRSVKSNKHRIGKPINKTHLSIRLDKRLYRPGKLKPYEIRITTANKRKTFKFHLYPKLQKFLDSMPYRDPLLYVDDKGHVCICLSFDKPVTRVKPQLCLGVDLGIRIGAACSDGRLITDKGFNARKRKLRFLKRKLQSKGTKSARRHLAKLRRKERNRNKNQTHLIANAILKTEADTIALENLKGIKTKKHRNQNKNAISQVPLYELRRIITYKAINASKGVVLVNPAYTSQTDSLTGKREGERRGRRFYAKSGLVYDADINAARNIGQRSKLPVSYGNILDGQGVLVSPRLNCQRQGIVNCPTVYKSRAQANVSQAATL